MANYVAKIEPIVLENHHPIGYYKYAEDFFETAVKCEKNTKFSPVPYYLYCMSIELVLKSFLLKNNVPYNDIKYKFSHDLEKAIKKTQELGLNMLDEDELKIINRANFYYYEERGFEYSQLKYALRAYKDWPQLEDLEKISDKLFKSVKPKIN